MDAFITLTHNNTKKKINIGAVFLRIFAPLLVNLSFHNIWKKLINIHSVFRQKTARL